MLTHRSCWVSPSFCRHWCLSASQWSFAQRNCRGNSDNGEGERMRQWTTSIFNCRNKLRTTIKFISKLSGTSNRARIIREKIKESLHFLTCSIGKVWPSIWAEFMMELEDSIHSSECFLRLANSCRVALAWTRAEGQKHVSRKKNNNSDARKSFTLCCF